MFGMETAGLKIRMETENAWVKWYCRDFLSEKALFSPDFSVTVSEAEIDEEIRNSENVYPSRSNYEAVCFLRSIARRLTEYDAFLFHAATVAVDGKAYSFAAASGTGKSTHIGLWKELLGDRMRYLNGDKPFIRKVGDKFYAYDNPWRGKEGYGGEITSAPMEAICFLSRGETNRIRAVMPQEALPAFLRQIYLPEDATAMLSTLSLADEFLAKVPLYLLSCNMEPEAAAVSFGAMSGKEE